MSSSGYLVPPSGENLDQDKLWNETWKRLDRFLPDLRKELDLDPKEPEKEISRQPLSPAAAEENKEVVIDVADE